MKRLLAVMLTIMALAGCTSPEPENLEVVQVDVNGRVVSCVILYSETSGVLGLSCDWSNR